MSEYNQYVTAVNKIFDYVAKMKAGWNSMDNINYIDSIEEYKHIVVNSVEKIKNIPPTKQIEVESLEVLEDD